MSEQVTHTHYIDLTDLTQDPTWPTRRQDLLVALHIMGEYEARTGQPLRLLEDWGEQGEGQFWVRLPEWLMELLKHYQARYGPRAEQILQRVMEELFPFQSLH